jgi:large subunit ribosomal protein L5
LISIVIPRIKDFRGLPVRAFDGRGNYAIGLREHTVFPEVDPTKVTKIRGLQVIICTNTGDDEKSKLLLDKLGVPFQKKR